MASPDDIECPPPLRQQEETAEEPPSTLPSKQKNGANGRKKPVLPPGTTPLTQLRAVLFPGWRTINWLLIFVPMGIGVNYVKGINPLVVFIFNFIAIIPLAKILGFATEELALWVGEVAGGLLNATFG